MSSPSSFPKGVHFVGSIPLPSAKETLTLLSTSLPNHIKRLPDGEPAKRQSFIYFQHFLFKPYPQLINSRFNKTGTSGKPLDNLDEVKTFLEKLETGYDTAAIESYATFKRLRDEAIVPKDVKFQVCIPTPMNTLSSAISPVYKGLVEPYYTTALDRALRNMQAAVPHEDLCVQIDCAHEFGLLEGVWKTPHDEDETRFEAWWISASSQADQQSQDAQEAQIFDGVIQRILNFAGPDHVPATVDLGFHLCYGDIGHKHFVEPKDTAIMVKVSKAVISGLAEQGRKVAYVHIPVPKERDDVDYFAPIRERGLLDVLKKGQTELYLGVVREDDEERTKRRIEAARKVLRDEVPWGVATECGMGRTPKEMVSSVLDIMKKVSAPIRQLQGKESKI